MPFSAGATRGPIAVLLGLLATGCSHSDGHAPRTTASADPTAEAGQETSTRRIRDLQEALAAREVELVDARLRLAEAEAELAARTDEANRLEERLRSTEAEWKMTVEALLRPESSHRRIDSRPLAVSRISELRVQLQTLQETGDPEVQTRLDRARELLSKADLALAEESPASAGFFAERAADLLRQASMVEEFRSISGNESHLPLVPPRRLRVAVPRANLRDGPGLDFERLETLEEARELTADARSGEWYRVELAGGLRGWIHESCVE